jgi:predicted DNA-binding transcriptional regulator AlpA
MASRELVLLREGPLAKKVGVSRDTLRKIRKNDPAFPRPRSVAGDVYGWLSSEVDRWLENRPLAERPY